MLILNILTFANLFLLFCLLYFRKDNVLPNKILALILLDPGINFLSNVSVLSGHFAQFPYVFFLAQATAFAFAPLVHMYILLLIGKQINFLHPAYLISAAAIIMVACFALEFSRMGEVAQKIYIDGLLNEPYPVQMNITNSVFILLQQLYFTISAIQVYKYRKTVSDHLSNREGTRVAYVSKFIILIWLLNLITIVLYITLPMTLVEYIILPVVLTVIYFFILYYSFHHHSVFTAGAYQDFLSGNKILEVKQQNIEQVLNADLITIAGRIEHFLSSEEPFVHPDLTLEILSSQMDIPVAKISMAINKVLKKNFYDLINEKRVKKSQLLLTELSSTNTIEYIAYESGFNSRASFYRAFKKYTGITPTEYLKRKTDY